MERTGGEAPYPLCARQRPRLPGTEPCRPKPEGETAVRTKGLLTAGRNRGTEQAPPANR